MSQQAIGKILLMPKGDYSGSATYNMLDWVRYDSKAWVCKLDNTVGVVPSEGANWTLLAADGTVSGSVAWSAVTSKPFSTIDSSDFDVDGNDELNIKRDTFGTVRVVSGGTTTDLEASGDSVVEIDAGTNVTITADDSTNPKKLTINSSGGGGGASALNDLSDVTITSPSSNQVLKYNGSGWVNGTGGGHEMIPIEEQGVTDIERLQLLTDGDDDYVINAYTAKRWSNVDAITLYTTLQAGTDTIGAWNDNWKTENPPDRSGWIWHTALLGILSDNDVDFQIVFDPSAEEAVSLYAYRVDDNYTPTGETEAGGCVAIKFNNAPSTDITVGISLSRKRTTAIPVTPLM